MGNYENNVDLWLASGGKEEKTPFVQLGRSLFRDRSPFSPQCNHCYANDIEREKATANDPKTRVLIYQTVIGFGFAARLELTRALLTVERS